MAGPVIAGLDIGINLTGFCVGDGSDIPKAGAWKFTEVGSDLGDLAKQFDHACWAMIVDYGVTHIIYEAPFLNRYRDQVLYLRKRFGLDMHLEFLCATNGIICEEEPVSGVKKELAGKKAAKADMVRAAEKIGVVLPAKDAWGREDAADAVGVWLVGIRHYAKQYQTRWDQALYGGRQLV